MKTPEELAEEYAKEIPGRALRDVHFHLGPVYEGYQIQEAFLAGMECIAGYFWGKDEMKYERWKEATKHLQEMDENPEIIARVKAAEQQLINDIRFRMLSHAPWPGHDFTSIDKEESVTHRIPLSEPPEGEK